jgi:hypothetical protein
MENNNLIKLSFNYYDLKKKEYKKYYNPIYKKYHDSTTNITYLKNNNNNILKVEEQFLGSFDKNTNIFTWGWYYYVNISEHSHYDNTYIIKKILNYILKMKIKNKDMIYNIRNIFLRYQYNISYPLELELILAMTLYITKSDMIYREDDKKEKIVYYLLRNVEIL